jgi:hypothetical protein
MDFLKLDYEAAQAVVNKFDDISLPSGIGPLQRQVQLLLYHYQWHSPAYSSLAWFRPCSLPFWN